jgi:hypothetical protein
MVRPRQYGPDDGRAFTRFPIGWTTERGMMTCIMFAALYITGGFLFLVSVAAHVYVRVRLRPRDPDLDDCYHEFEDQHPEYARYTRWLQITLSAAALGLLLMFVPVVL